MSEEIKQKEERFEDNWLVFCDIVNSEGDTQAKVYLNSFIQSEIELALQKRDEEWLRKIYTYQNGWVKMHDRGADNPPEPEFAPEYEVIEQLLSTLTTK